MSKGEKVSRDDTHLLDAYAKYMASKKKLQDAQKENERCIEDVIAAMDRRQLTKTVIVYKDDNGYQSTAIITVECGKLKHETAALAEITPGK